MYSEISPTGPFDKMTFRGTASHSNIKKPTRKDGYNDGKNYYLVIPISVDFRWEYIYTSFWTATNQIPSAG